MSVVPNSLRIGVANVHGGIRADGSPFDVPATLEELRADVIVVPEAFWPDDGPSFIDEFARRTGYHACKVSNWNMQLSTLAHRGPHTPGDWGLAVLTRHEPLSVAQVPLGSPPGLPRECRTALVVSAATKTGPVWVAGVHLSHRVPYWPARQLARLVRNLPPGPGAIAGDCNLWGPAALAVLKATCPLQRFHRAVLGRTWPAQFPLAQIDHVLTRDLMTSSGRVVPATGSDHHMVIADVARHTPSAASDGPLGSAPTELANRRSDVARR